MPFSPVQLQSVSSGKRKLEVDLQQLTQEHEEMQGELRTVNDKAKKAVCEVLDIHPYTLTAKKVLKESQPLPKRI